MAGQPEKDKNAVRVIQEWTRAEVTSGQSLLVKALKQFDPYELQDEEEYW